MMVLLPTHSHTDHSSFNEAASEHKVLGAVSNLGHHFIVLPL